MNTLFQSVTDSLITLGGAENASETNRRNKQKRPWIQVQKTP